MLLYFVSVVCHGEDTISSMKGSVSQGHSSKGLLSLRLAGQKPFLAIPSSFLDLCTTSRKCVCV